MTRQTKNDPNSKPTKTRPVITLDYDLYAHYLDDADLSEEQKREFLQTLWNLIVEIMSLGFDIHPVQQAQKPCGKLSKNRKEPPFIEADAVQLNSHILEHIFSDATDGKAP